jgi:hypothetical protein
MRSESLRLARGALVRLDASRGVEVSVRCGRVWITQERDARDLWLTAGESVQLEGEGLALIEADRDAHVRIERVHN